MESLKNEFNIKKIIENIISYFSFFPNENIKLKYTIDSKLPQILIGDSETIEELLKLLIKHSISTTNKGEILLKLDLLAQYNSEVVIKFSVIDNGIGITEEEQINLFKFFVETNEFSIKKYKHSNSELFQIKKIIKILDSNIGFTSKFMEGTKFYFQLKLGLENEKKYRRIQEEKTIFKGIDLNDALERLGGNIESVRKVIEAFIFEFENIMEKIENCLSQDKINEVEDILHSLKGSASNISAKDLYKVSLEAEIFFKNNKYISLEIFENLKNNLNIVLANSKKFNPTRINNIKLSSENHLEVKKYKILVVDDSPTNIKIIAETLKENYNILASTNGLNAIKISKELKPDLILMDIVMPELDGFETTKLIKGNEESKNIPIIFISAKNEIENKIIGELIGANSYLQKPINYKELITNIEMALNTN